MRPLGPGRGRGPHQYDYSVMFGSASTSNGEISPRSNFRRATSAIMAALSVHAERGGTVTRMPWRPSFLIIISRRCGLAETPPPMQYSLHPVACSAF